MNTESTLTFIIDTGTNFGRIVFYAQSELHAFREFVDLYGSHFNGTLTITFIK